MGIEDLVLAGQNPLATKLDLLVVSSMNNCIDEAKSLPIPRKLFSGFWYEGELAILFADTGVGKSLLAVQIADHISRGTTNDIFEVEAPAQIVLYLDFELKGKQLENRYSDHYENHYRFHDNFLRASINASYDSIDDFDTLIEVEIERLIEETGAKVMIVDNISFLKTQSNDTAKEASPLMKRLIQLKHKYDMAILVLAHTPKRDETKSIEINHLAGSKILSNFVDSIFAIGQSFKDTNLRYIKQLKARDSEKFYGSDYVIVCKVEKNINCLSFNHIGFENEQEHLKHVSQTEQDELDEKILELRKTETQLTENAIATQLGTNHKRVDRVLKRNGLK